MTEESKETTSEDIQLKGGIVSQLEGAISDFQEEKISGHELLAEASNAWKKAIRNKELKARIEGAMRKMRLAIHQLAPLDVHQHGDPIMQRYNPNYWLGDIRKEFKSEEEIEKFILERTRSLKEFFENL